MGLADGRAERVLGGGDSDQVDAQKNVCWRRLPRWVT
jgi:hypothetical protein